MYLTPYHGPEFPQQRKPPPPPPIELEEQGLQYEIERILDVARLPTRKKRKLGRLKYLVHWKGYDNPEDHTWEYAEEMENAQEIVEEYHRNNPEKPGPENRISAIQTTRDQDERLFNPTHNQLGNDFTMPVPITDYAPKVIVCLDAGTIELFVHNCGDPNLIWMLPKLHSSTRHVWIYDMTEREIAYIVDFNNQHIPVHMWFLLNPCTFQTLL